MIRQVFKNILLSINIAISIALIFSLAGAYISPVQMPYLVILNLAFPYLVLINFISILFWAFLKHKYFYISAITLVISLPILLKTIQFSPFSKNAQTLTSFKIMSYNVRVFDLYDWSNNKVTRNNMFQFIRKQSPQIACFQEFFNGSKNYFPVHDSLINKQTFKYAHNYYNVELNNGHQFGIATYSDFPIINKKEILFKETHNLAIISDIKINNDTLRVINCHLESVRFLEKDYDFIDSVTLLPENRRIEGFKGVTKRLLLASQKRAIQAERINKIAHESPYPTIVCGDFNDTPYSYTYSKASNKLSDSFKKHSMGIGGTYNRFFPSLRIDYMLYDESIVCNKLITFKNEYSDHYPLVGSFNFAE